MHLSDTVCFERALSSAAAVTFDEDSAVCKITLCLNVSLTQREETAISGLMCKSEKESNQISNGALVKSAGFIHVK